MRSSGAHWCRGLECHTFGPSAAKLGNDLPNAHQAEQYPHRKDRPAVYRVFHAENAPKRRGAIRLGWICVPVIRCTLTAYGGNRRVLGLADDVCILDSCHVSRCHVSRSGSAFHRPPDRQASCVALRDTDVSCSVGRISFEAVPLGHDDTCSILLVFS